MNNKSLKKKIMVSLMAGLMVFGGLSYANCPAEKEQMQECEKEHKKEEIVPQTKVTNSALPDSKVPLGKDKYMTKYGPIKKPSDFHMNDDLWTDEEFHQILLNQEKLQLIKRKEILGGFFPRFKTDFSSQNTDLKERTDLWYYDTKQRQFFYRVNYEVKQSDGSYTWETEYVNMDGMTGGQMFKTMKALLYHANKHNLEVDITSGSEGYAFLTVGKEGKMEDYRPFHLQIIYDTKRMFMADSYARDIKAFKKDKQILTHIWELKDLIDFETYDDELDAHNRVIMPEEFHEVKERLNCAQQDYADFLYGVCEAIYEEDGEDIYIHMMAEEKYTYIYAWENRGKKGTDNSHLYETKNYRFFKWDHPKYRPSYLIGIK